MPDNKWLESRTKRILLDTVIVVTLDKEDDVSQSADLYVRAIELTYGHSLYFEAACPVLIKDANQWISHPFMYSNKYLDGYVVGNIIDDTLAIRAMIEELISTNTTRHKARLIKAISSFWT